MTCLRPSRRSTGRRGAGPPSRATAWRTRTCRRARPRARGRAPTASGAVGSLPETRLERQDAAQRHAVAADHLALRGGPLPRRRHAAARQHEQRAARDGGEEDEAAARLVGEHE